MEYKTVTCSAMAQMTEKKSRFLAYVSPVTCEEQAVEFINEIRSRHRDATHNVYAYVLRDNHIQRYSDDGEPGGTAGIPVLEAIKKRDLIDVVVVVTRYFGGVLLGSGGLVRAYSACAVLGICKASPVIKKLCRRFSITCDYSLSGKVAYELAKGAYHVEDTQFMQDVTFLVCVCVEEEEEFVWAMTEATGAKAVLEKKDTKYIEMSLKEDKV